MFKVHDSSRVPMPARLTGGSGTAVHAFVEVTNNLPVWVLQVLSPAQDEHEIDRWRRFFVSNLRGALALSESHPWLARNLYVMLPDYVARTDRGLMALCLTVWKCEEADGGSTCWRMETDKGIFLDSLQGSVPGEETQGQIVWSASGPGDGRACGASMNV